MQRRKTGKISIFSSLDVIFDFLTSWVKNSNQVLTWSRYQIESECWNQVFESSQKIDIEYLSWIRRFISKLDLMISLMLQYDFHIQRSVLSALQEVIEDFMIFFMKNKCIILLHYHSCCRILINILLYADINLTTIHVKHIIIQDKDMRFMKNLMMNLDVKFFKTD